ncbi:Anoctamin-10 [Armadillidium nasatum]|uniref:Anoctamin n=1 Tax=Armadillidium nasatum TaxID=96803 RepID=A0A5N5STY7_9CRUS|nr:Anoctamin-10 [Armadillidium nasatum]
MLPSDSDDERDNNIPDGPGATSIPPSIYIIKFHQNTKREAIEWLLEKIEAKQKYGGAELFVRSEPQKQTQDFSVRELDQFLFGDKTLDSVLTPSEREYCVRHELEGIRAKAEDAHVAGYPEIKMFPGQSIVDVYIKEELITDFYPLHDRVVLEDLGNRWYKSIFHGASLEVLFSPFTLPSQSKRSSCTSTSRLSKRSEGDEDTREFLDEIRNYFGESVGIYFGFLGFYTLTLIAPAILGVIQMFFSVDTLSEHAFFAAFNLVWVTVFLELWKRRCAELAYTWGTLDRTHPPVARANYWGDMRQNPITGRFEPFYPVWKTKCKLFFVSIPVVGFCMLFALWTMVVAFWAEEQLIDWKRQYGSLVSVFLNFPSAIYAGIVWLMNFHYKKLSHFLTEWENHRTDEEHEWHRVSKLVAFEFVNNFSSLFYIAFYIQDMDMLCSQVATMLIVTQMINHFQEALLPLVVKKAYNQFSETVVAELKKHPWTEGFFVEPVKPVHSSVYEEQQVPVLSLDSKDPRILQAKEEAELDPYSGVYEDFLEMFLQFGYVFLFSAVYPMAAFWAVLNNVLELKTDAFKLCRLYQRPRSRKVAGIGVWQNAFELMGAVAVMTNCALLCLSPRVRPLAPNASPVEWVLIFVAFEHIILALKMSLVRCFPDRPEWVRDAMDRVIFHAKMALRNERGKKTRRHLSRRFRSVHGMPRSGSRSRATTPVAQNGSIRRRSSDYRDYRE